LSDTQNALLLSEDTLLADLYPGGVTDIPSYVACSNKIKTAIRGIVVDTLRLGTPVVLDFPANTKDQRQWLLSIATEASVPHELHFIDLPDAVCKAQLKKRASENPERRATDTEAMFDAITQYFQAPMDEEGLTVIRINPM